MTITTQRLWIVVPVVIGSLCLVIAWHGQSAGAQNAEPKTPAETDAVPAIQLQRVQPAREARFGERREMRLSGVSGSSLEAISRSGVFDAMLREGVTVMLRHDGEGAGFRETTVTGIYPETFSPGCVVVIACEGPLPHN